MLISAENYWKHSVCTRARVRACVCVVVVVVVVVAIFFPHTSASLVAALGFLPGRCDACVKRQESRFSFMKLSHFVPAAERHRGP